MDEMEVDEINLLDFPDEILLTIFYNLSDHTLLRVIGVCKRFETIAKASFAQKYNGITEKSFYSLKISGENIPDECAQYQRIFRNFGNGIRAIKIKFKFDPVAKNHWLFAIIQRYCKSITKVNIGYGRGVDLYSIISHLPNLSELNLDNVEFSNQKWTQYTYPKLISLYARDSQLDIETFLDHNEQLEHLTLYFFRSLTKVINALNGKLNLKSLVVYCEKNKFVKMDSIAVMNNLQSLCVSIGKDSFQPLLSTIRSGLTKIEKLEVAQGSNFYKLLPGDINLLCSFITLKSLLLQGCLELSLEQVTTIVMRLPNLVTLSLGETRDLCETPEDILNVASVCHKLTLLQLDVISEPTHLEYDFCVRFASLMDVHDSNLKMELVFYETDKMIFTREESRLVKELGFRDDKSHRVLHWKGYDALNSSTKNLLKLESVILKKILTYLDANALSEIFQTCEQLRSLVLEHINDKIFRCAVDETKRTKENVFVVLGNYIRNLDVDLTFDFDDDKDVEGSELDLLKTKFLKCVNRHCRSLTELNISDVFRTTKHLCWPSLKKLTVDEISPQTLRMFRCPELTYLCVENSTVCGFELWESCFPKLSSLKCIARPEMDISFLCNERIRNQVTNLEINGSFKQNIQYRSWLKLINNIVRFDNLRVLHLYVDGIEKSNYKFLFENCSMLTDVAIKLGDEWSFEKYVKIFQSIKHNCKRLENVRLFAKNSIIYRNPESLRKIYQLFPNATLTSIGTESTKCLSEIVNGKS